MKRKRTDKLTTAELIAAGHTELAKVLRERLAVSIKGRRPFRYRRLVRQRGTSYSPTPSTQAQPNPKP